MTKTLLSSIFFLFLSYTLTCQQSVGQWADHLSYLHVDEVAYSGNRVFCAAGGGFFTYDLQSQELTRYSKINGLSDVGVSTLAFSETVGALVVGYNSGNIDIVMGDEVINLPDIVISTLIGDKTIYSITIEEDHAWLGCGFGIVVIDLINIEVSDTYFIGDGGANTRVNDILVDVDKVYAATSTGLLEVPRLSNLADFASWNLVQNGLPNLGIEFLGVESLASRVIAFDSGVNQSAYAFNGTSWTLIPGTTGLGIRSMRVNEDQLIVAHRYFTQVRNIELQTVSTFSDYPNDITPNINSAILTDSGDFLIADEKVGLVMVRNGVVQFIFPDSPAVDVTWKAAARDGDLWLAHGRLLTTFDNEFSNDGTSGFSSGDWRRYEGQEMSSSVRDVVDAEIDMFDGDKVHYASFTAGLVTYSKAADSFLLDNSELEPSSLTPDRIQVGGLEYDINGNLWVTNNYTALPFKIKRQNGTWTALGCAAIAQTQVLGDMAITESGQTWIVLPRSGGLAVLQHGNNLDDTSSHQCKRFSTTVGDGDLPTQSVLSIEEDLDGEIWVGTSEGPVVNYSPQSIFGSNPVDFQPILVERDGNIERLLGSESITAIEVDGANRKWIGTLTGGAFLLSESGTEEIVHFTEENSPLFSNAIKDIAIDDITGAVHFSTNAGVITYMGDATIGGEENVCYDVYPNPVRPEYRGPITIGGLVADSEVKITDLAGNIVFQTISNGGRAIWKGSDFSGNRVSTGVYFALVSDREGETVCISKILFIN